LKYLPKIEISKYLKILQEQLEPYTTTIHISNSLFFLFKKNIKGSSADKSDLQIGDEILEINGKNVCDYNHSQIISYIHNVSLQFCFHFFFHCEKIQTLIKIPYFKT